MKHMLFMLFLMVSTCAFAQHTEVQQPVGNEPLLKEIASLKTLADNVNVASNEVAVAASGSRAQGQAANQKLAEACNAYLAELNVQLAASTNNAALTDALNREIAATKKLTPQTDNPTRK